MNQQLPRLTFDQAKRAKAVGFDWPTKKIGWELDGQPCIEPFERYATNWNQKENIYSIPENALFLQWAMSVKEIKCGVTTNVRDGNNFNGDYMFDCLKNGKIYSVGGFDSHPEAESALIDEILTILEK